MAKKVETKKAAAKETKKVAVKEVKEVKETKCDCNCNCECNNAELVNYVKYSFYALVCIFVCVLISTVFVIILAVGDDKKETKSTTKNTVTTNNNGSGEEDAEYDVSMFTQITAQELINLYNGSEKSVIYIGRATCGYCVKFLPALQKAQDELGYKTYYYDISTITSDEYYEIIALNDFLNNNFGSTPMVIVVQNGQILSANNDNQGWVGYAEYDTFKAYMQGLGY